MRPSELAVRYALGGLTAGAFAFGATEIAILIAIYETCGLTHEFYRKAKQFTRFGRMKKNGQIHYMMIVRDAVRKYHTVMVTLQQQQLSRTILYYPELYVEGSLDPICMEPFAEPTYVVSVKIVNGVVKKDNIADENLPVIWETEFTVSANQDCETKKPIKKVLTSECSKNPNQKRINGIYIPEIGSTLVLDRNAGLSVLGLLPYKITELSNGHIGQTASIPKTLENARVWKLHPVWWTNKPKSP